MLALQNARLAAFDFDNTIADTFSPSPNGIDVHKAYSLALERLFGEKLLLARVGGLKNRAPAELVAALISEEPRLVVNAMRNYDVLRRDMPLAQGKGMRLVPIKDGNCVSLLGEMLVRLKLEILMREIGPAWPRPFGDALEFLDCMRAHGKHVAILSSGHDAFIKKCFVQWNADCPAILLTDDDLRMMGGPLERRIKPSALLMTYLVITARRHDRLLTKNDIVYFGDDIEKDGRLAWNASVPFGWYKPGQSEPDPRFGPDDFVVSCWKVARDSFAR